MQITFCGANRQVTGSSYHVRVAGLNLLVDRGLFQERQFQDRNWNEPPYDPRKLDAVLLTHAHLDHCGLLPRLVAQGFDGPIWCTEPTVELAPIVMLDSARLQQEDAEYKQKRHAREKRKGKFPYKPLYSVDDAARTAKMLRGVRYDQPIKLNDQVTVRFFDAGHILGSAMLRFEITEGGRTRRVVFSGDLGQNDVPIVEDPTLLHEADTVIMESTYGDRDHDRRVEIETQLAEVINLAVERRGLVLIPTFAIERAQELLLHIARLRSTNTIPRVPLFLDSPMAINVTEVFRKHRNFMDEPTQRMLESGELDAAWRDMQMVRTAEQSKQLNDRRGPGIILAGSGMCTGGRIKHHLANHIGRTENTVLFVGYQAIGTLGRQILDRNPSVRIFGVPRDVGAMVRRIDGLSAHAGRSDLLHWIKQFRQPLPRVYLTHGDEDAALSLAELIEKELKFTVTVPRYKETHDA